MLKLYPFILLQTLRFGKRFFPFFIKFFTQQKGIFASPKICFTHRIPRTKSGTANLLHTALYPIAPRIKHTPMNIRSCPTPTPIPKTYKSTETPQMNRTSAICRPTVPLQCRTALHISYTTSTASPAEKKTTACISCSSGGFSISQITSPKSPQWLQALHNKAREWYRPHSLLRYPTSIFRCAGPYLV